MPEGDTLHAHARSIDRALGGQTLLRAESTRVDLSRFAGQRLIGATAQGKHLLVEFESGHVLRTHLRMHGVIRVRGEGYRGPITNPHVRWLLSSDRASALCLDAPSIELTHKELLASHPVLSRLGPDLLGAELDAAEIVARLSRDPERVIGSALMDQELLAGIGNVYKSEVLFITETSPFARVMDLPQAQLLRIIETARELMRRNLSAVSGSPGIPGGGLSRRTTPRGRISSPYWVYERSGELCMRCGERVAMQRQDPLARSTYYCTGCQPLPASDRS
jgi:endonuclease-8